jgi:hypothetical protein
MKFNLIAFWDQIEYHMISKSCQSRLKFDWSQFDLDNEMLLTKKNLFDMIMFWYDLTNLNIVLKHFKLMSFLINVVICVLFFRDWYRLKYFRFIAHIALQC